MYKIMTKLHTTRENVFAFHMITNDMGEEVEYTVNTPEEAASTALELLSRVGYEDLRIVEDKSYYLDLIYGTKAKPEPKLYTLTLIGPEGFQAYPDVIENIKENSTVQSKISFDAPVFAFHLIIDGEVCDNGLPTWITYEEESDLQGTLIFSGITNDHTIEIVVDEYLISA